MQVLRGAWRTLGDLGLLAARFGHPLSVAAVSWEFARSRVARPHSGRRSLAKCEGFGRLRSRRA